MPNYGYQFSPGLQNQFRRSLNGQAAQLPANASTALQVLSLNLPSVLAGSPIAPDALLKPGPHGSAPIGDPLHAPNPSVPPPPPQPLNPSTPGPLTVIPPPSVPTPSPVSNGVPIAPQGPANPLAPAGPDSGPSPDAPAPPPGFVFRQPRPPDQPTQPPQPPGGANPISDLLSSLFGPANGAVGPGGGRDWLGPGIDRNGY